MLCSWAKLWLLSGDEGSIPMKNSNVGPRGRTIMILVNSMITGGIWFLRYGVEVQKSTPGTLMKMNLTSRPHHPFRIPRLSDFCFLHPSVPSFLPRLGESDSHCPIGNR